MTDAPQILLQHHLKQLRLPTFQEKYAKQAQLNGGAGSDFALYDGNLADYTLTRTSATDVTIAHADGTDSLTNVEYFQFDDTTANIWELAIV